MRPLAAALLVLAMLGGSAHGWAEPRKTKAGDAQLICFRYGTFRLLADERVVDYKIGIDVTSVTIGSRTDKITISESSAWPVPTQPREQLLAKGQTEIYRYGGAAHRYAVMAPAPGGMEAKPLIWLSVVPLTGNGDDAAIYARVELRDPGTVKCQQSFVSDVAPAE
ncbi:hypothetical protein [Sphingobium nicotianae]|uniref:Uncharacterized protein n=1 Tax=Sphingobium nicotianae TaxID=2782607 RepID=A0A9X1IQ90_9SPHN|nr:hypothetical protein [Sphingobium nicotianae]MBT2186598.1 hypothetical protein [Sphingobium nicotianae]